MTNNQAHEYMENIIRCVQRAGNGICTRNCSECNLMREDQPLLEAYVFAVLALEKQIPKKPKLSRLSTKRNKLYVCPTCSNQCLEKEANERQDNMYCWNCGQALDWS